ncbi:MAG TPA: GcrA family cell cycle regulator [Beijerinckiaceae bacterium]|jgi:GcrA cell cycle regulator
MADWSDADIRTVKAMWRKGATATVIAEALGEGFTRGAVLGKIHRLGLKKVDEAPPKAAARPAAKAVKTTAKPAAKSPAKATAKPAVKPVVKAAAKPAGSAAKPAAHAAPVQARPKPTAPAKPIQMKPIQAKSAQPKPVEKPRIVARTPEPVGPQPIWALGQCQCRWPIGNLLDPPGLFCGAVTADGSSWCPVHERMVYTGSNRPRPEAAREAPRFAVAGGRSRF